MRRFSAYFTRLVASLVAGGSLSLLLATNAMAAGMPQMDFKNPLVIGQVFWVLLIFLCLFLAVKYFSIPQIERAIENRQSKISEDMETARQAKAQADKAVIALNKTRNDAAIEAQSQIENILRETKAASSKRMSELRSYLDQEARDADMRISVVRNQAMTHVDQMAKEVAQTLIKKMLNESIDDAILGDKISQNIAIKSQ